MSATTQPTAAAETAPLAEILRAAADRAGPSPARTWLTAMLQHGEQAQHSDSVAITPLAQEKRRRRKRRAG